MTSNFYHQDLALPYQPLYLDFDKHMSRLSADIPYADKDLIKLVCPKRGILNQLTQLFFSSVCEEMKQSGLTYYSPENEQAFIAIIRRRTAPQPPRKRNDGNVGRRTKKPHSASKRGV